MTIRVEDLERMDFSDVAQGNKLSPVTPGEILLEEFLKPMEITQYRLAKEIGVPQRRIGEIVAGKRAITVDTGLRLSRFFGMNDGFWTGLQTDYDTAREKVALADVLARIHRFVPAHTPAP
jgi:addiction module HigA family antidote